MDLSKVIIGATEKKETGRQAPPVRVPVRTKYRGQCATCGGRHVIESAGVTMLCPYCTGYQQCGL
jgi:hypothetical protein